jgi:hypothetical protein
MPPASITLLAGLLLIAIGLVGGGIEIKEVKIPPLPMVPRAASFVVGCLLIGLVFLNPSAFNIPPAAQPSDRPGPLAKAEPKKDLGTAITNGLIQVSDVKRVLQHLGMYQGPITNEATPGYFQAVGEFQRSQNIVQDGLVGGETLGKLQQAWPEFFPKPK